MEENKSIFRIFFWNVTESFTFAILGLAVTGWFFGDAVSLRAGVFILEGGISYSTILQFFAWACVMGVLITVLAADFFFKNIMLLWRNMILFILGLVATAGFALIFEWIPFAMWEAWLAFLLFFTLTFGIGLLFMYVKTKHEDRRYEKLLFDYKANQENEKGEEKRD